MTTGDAVDTFLIGYFGLNHRSSKTKTAYTTDLKQLRDHNGTHIPLADVGPDAIESWARFLQSKPYAISSIRRKLASARVFFNYWERRGAIQDSPMWRLRLSLGRERILPRSLSPTDTRSLIEEVWRGQSMETLPSVTDTNTATLRVRDVAIIETLFATGMRVGELAKLRLSDWQRDDLFFWSGVKAAKKDSHFCQTLDPVVPSSDIYRYVNYSTLDVTPSSSTRAEERSRNMGLQRFLLAWPRMPGLRNASPPT